MMLIWILIQTLLEWVRAILGEVLGRGAGDLFDRWRKRKKERREEPADGSPETSQSTSDIDAPTP
jgi:hypothetical protein